MYGKYTIPMDGMVVILPLRSEFFFLSWLAGDDGFDMFDHLWWNHVGTEREQEREIRSPFNCYGNGPWMEDVFPIEHEQKSFATLGYMILFQVGTTFTV